MFDQIEGRTMIVLASASQDTLAQWTSVLHGFAPLLVVSEVSLLETALLEAKPQILMLDFDLPAMASPKSIAGLINLNPSTKTVVWSRDISNDTELALFKIGVRGCCRNDIEPQLLKRVIVAVRQGELWIRRTLTHRLLDELGTTLHDDVEPKRVVVGRLAELTQREKEIAALIGSGESNKQIARQLDISERTVKFHLTQIFRKLDISDRVNLAVLMTGTSDG